MEILEGSVPTEEISATERERVTATFKSGYKSRHHGQQLRARHGVSTALLQPTAARPRPCGP